MHTKSTYAVQMTWTGGDHPL